MENQENVQNKKQKSPLKFFLNSSKVSVLVGKCVLLFVIPYIYLLLCGLIFDKLLKMYFMTTFIFYSLLFLYIVAIVLIVIAVMRYIKKKQDKA